MTNKNGIKFPTDHGYLCGHGVRVSFDNMNHISIFEDESHNCLDIKGFISGKHIWEQYFYWDYEPEDITIEEKNIDYAKVREMCQKDAEDKFMNLVKEMR